jgi:hypothetical protein
MKLKEVYEKYQTPLNLQEHMLAVARCAAFFKEHWQGVAIDWPTVILSCLLHDLGNIVKFDLSGSTDLFGSGGADFNHLKEVQSAFIEKYGTDDHLATKKILAELHLNGQVITAVQNKSFGNSVAVAQGTDWYTKILAYADLRVTPHGIGTLDDRVADIKARMPKYTERPDFPQLINSAYEVEKQIQDALNVPLTQLADGCAQISKEQFLELELN